MNIPVTWLNQYLEKPLSPDVMAGALEAAGIEVEGITQGVQLDDKIIIGSVKDIAPHPDADKLRVAQVDVGKETLEIVCGAPNLAVGQRVAVATHGAKLPDGGVIKKSKLRGVTSNGMICSMDELGLGGDHSGIMILSDTAPIGKPLNEIVVVSDVIDTTTAANRWDLNGIIWLAYEVAAQSKQKMVAPELKPQPPIGAPPSCKVADGPLVPRYLLAELKIDLSKPSPEWLQNYLQGIGVRPINVVVDITNVVMYEYGQPLHAFDVAKVKLPVMVRQAEKSEKITTLDGTSHNLNPADILITDGSGPIALAGVMGGRNSEVDSTTTAIYLESAVFDATSIRRTAQRHNLRTDASSRFERGLPLQLPELAMARAIKLLEEHAGATLVGGPADVLARKPQPVSIQVQPDSINGILGLELPAHEIALLLEKLAFGVKSGGKELTVNVPWWRTDVTTKEDIAEEVIKLIGYAKLPSTLPEWRPTAISFDRQLPLIWGAKSALRSLGWFEVTTYSFISKQHITELDWNPKQFLKLQNPLSIEQAYLRTDLFPSLLKTTEQNRTYSKEFGIFELSKVYHPKKKGELPREPQRLGVMVRSASNGYKSVKATLDRLSQQLNVPITIETDVVDTTVFHPTRSGNILIGKKKVGVIGQLHPALAASKKLSGEVGYLEIDWEPFTAASEPKQYQPVNKFPTVTRDLSLILDRAISWQQISQELSEYDVTFQSDYYGSDLPKNKKSMTIRLTLSNSERTLTDKEADEQAAKAFSQVKSRFSASLR